MSKRFFPSKHCVPRTLTVVENLLNKWLKPDLNAEKWDNVGLLVGSGKYTKDHKCIENIMLCIDLTTKVVSEAIEKKIDLIIAYHPPIFKPLMSVAYNTVNEQIITKCIANDICVYSPHTALDNITGGINDYLVWLLAGKFFSSRPPVIPRVGTPAVPGAVLFCPPQMLEDTIKYMNNVPSLQYGFVFPQQTQEVGIDIECDTALEGCSKDMVAIRAFHPDKFNEESIAREMARFPSGVKYSLEESIFQAGVGRQIEFETERDIQDLLTLLRVTFGAKYVQIAYAGKILIKTVAFCAGAGGSVLRSAEVDLVITGEMSHHEILSCTSRGTMVVLVGHSQSERFYLHTLQYTLEHLLDVPSVIVSQEDREPLILDSDMVIYRRAISERLHRSP